MLPSSTTLRERVVMFKRNKNETSSCFSIHSSRSLSLHVHYSHNRLVAQPAVSISVEERGAGVA